MKVAGLELTLPTEGHASLRPPQELTNATKQIAKRMNLNFLIL